MPSTDIYHVKEPAWAKAQKPDSRKRRRRRPRTETFDETVNKDVSRTHRRRSKNSGLRRFIHLMRKPEFSKKFWTIALSVFGSILLILLIWDWFFRYAPETEPDYGDAYEMQVD